MKNFNR